MQDTLSPPGQPNEIASEHRFPCDQCGADFRFDPERGMLICDHCGNSSNLADDAGATISIREIDIEQALDAKLPEADIEETRVSNCPNCAAQVEFDPNLHSRECPFCATPVVIDTGTHRHIKPRGVLPFALDEKSASEAMKEWLGRLWFAPNGLQAYARKGRSMQGIYVPYWTFDAQTESRYTGERGTVYYETRTVNRNGRRETQRVAKVRWRSVRGRVARFFDDVLVLASKSLPKRFTDALEPWDLAALEPYRPEFLAGFRAEGYQIELREGYELARAAMDVRIRRDIKFDIGGDRQRIHSVETEVSDVTFKHILLPVWVAAFKFRGQTYRTVINGRTGRVRGERPWSVVKIAVAVILLLILGGLLAYAIALDQQGRI